MAELSLPKEVNFASPLPQLPDNATSTLYTVQSTNGIQFNQSQVVQFDLLSQPGVYIDPKSIFIRYRLQIVTGALATSAVKRKPIYTMINRLEEFIGSTPVSSVYQYNLVSNGFIDTNFSYADVQGQAYGFGIGTPTTYPDVDGVLLAANTTTNIYCAAPLVCSAISNLSHFYPTGLSAPWRIQITLASITEAFIVPANVTSYTILQPELCFNVVNLGSQVDAMVAQMSPRLRIKTLCSAASSQSMPAGSNGFMTLPFNHRYESIGSLFLYSTTNDVAKGINTFGDSFNPLGLVDVSGSIQFQINQQLYPQLPVNNATGGIASVLQYLRNCNGSITDQRNTMAINNPNFTKYAGNASASSADEPAKWIFGVNLNKVNPSNPYASTALLSGTSAASTPINVLLNTGTAFNSAMNFYLVAEYDAIIEIDPMMRQVNIIC